MGLFLVPLNETLAALILFAGIPAQETALTSPTSIHMQLPPHLRQSFQEAYRASFGRDIDAARAERLALYLLDTLGLALTILCESRLQRSGATSIDKSDDGRDSEQT